jgi:16S rRNA C967 or C1407 C5-methylase (RsmB/RsmF family)
MYDRILCDVPCSGDGTLRKDLKVCSQLKHVAARTNAPTHTRLTHPTNTPD